MFVLELESALLLVDPEIPGLPYLDWAEQPERTAQRLGVAKADTAPFATPDWTANGMSAVETLLSTSRDTPPEPLEAESCVPGPGPEPGVNWCKMATLQDGDVRLPRGSRPSLAA